MLLSAASDDEDEGGREDEGHEEDEEDEAALKRNRDAIGVGATGATLELDKLRKRLQVVSRMMVRVNSVNGVHA